MKIRAIQAIMKDYGLKPATERDLYLFTLSCVGLAYTRLLKEYMGFSYDAMAAVGKRKYWQTFLNESSIAEKTFKLIKKEKKFRNIYISSADAIIEKCERQFSEAKKIFPDQPRQALKMICDFYPPCFTAIGIINCFWRFSQKSEYINKLPKAVLDQLANDRDRITKWYPEVELLVNSCLNKITKNKKLANLLVCSTLEEMKKYLETGSFKVAILEQRSKGFYYLIGGKIKELVIHDKSVIRLIKKSYFRPKLERRELKGFGAYPGKVKAKVFLLKQKSIIPKKFILVASSTHPKFLPIIKRASAIIADEGGVLSHAAIIAREFKIPCVIGTKIATKVLRNDDLIEVDARKGIVKILK